MKTLVILGAILAAAPFAIHTAVAAPDAARVGLITSTAQANSLSEGEIRNIDRATKMITIEHGELKNLGMPGMTMPFHAANPALLDTVKVGDKVRFMAAMVRGQLTVMKIEVVH